MKSADFTYFKKGRGEEKRKEKKKKEKRHVVTSIVDSALPSILSLLLVLYSMDVSRFPFNQTLHKHTLMYGWSISEIVSSWILTSRYSCRITSGRGELTAIMCVPQHIDIRVQELCESRGGRHGLSVLTSLLVSVDVKLY